jgi:thymidylate synthase (FAD)
MTDAQFHNDVYVEFVDFMGSDLDIARNAWVSTKGERAADEQDDSRIDGLINFLMKGRHGSPFECVTFKFLVKAPIFVWREHHRHRIGFSYNEESGRYRQLEPEFYIPSPERNLRQEGKPGEYVFLPGTPEQQLAVHQSFMQSNLWAYSSYEMLLKADVAREVARMCLPLNIYSSCYVTCNARSLMSFLSLRTKDDASMFPSYPQREIEMVAEKYEQFFAATLPMTHKAFIANGRVSP